MKPNERRRSRRRRRGGSDDAPPRAASPSARPGISACARRSRERGASRLRIRERRPGGHARMLRPGSRPAAAVKRGRSAGASRHFPSGVRRQAPEPEQGASTNTTSQGGTRPRSRSSGVRISARAPARRARAGRSFIRATFASWTIRRPRPPIAAASASALPPPPAQKSSTVIPGRDAGRGGGELARNVLQFDHSLGVGAALGHEARVLDNTQRVRDEGMRLREDRIAGEGHDRRPRARLERIHPEVDRGASDA
jgi:hypothetical protein